MSLTIRLDPRHRLALWGCLTALAAVGSCGTTDHASPPGVLRQAGVCAAGAVVKGVDVSVFQGDVTWPTVKAAGIDFAIARISDGTYLDTKFAQNWSGMKSAGIVRGAYQFFEPGDDPVAQANIVINAVGMLGNGDLPVTADMEVTGGQSAATIVANLQTWVSHVQAGTGKAPMIYTALGFWDGSVGSSAFASLPLWAANWGVTCPSLATGWSNWKVWQYSDSGTVAGISGNVDLDEFNGDLAALNAFAGGADWGATYVAQSFPLATTALVMQAGDSVPAWIQLKNSGTKTWDSKTHLGTTQPRDRVSVFAAADWLQPDRPAGVTGTVAPGQTYKFQFTLQAPDQAGTYSEFFGVLEEGVAWFSDPGQGGPPDNQLEVKIEVRIPDGGIVQRDAGAVAQTDGGSDDGGGDTLDGGAVAEDGSPAGDAGDGDAGAVHAHGAAGGCAVGGAAAAHRAATPGLLIAVLAALTIRIRRSARRRH